MLLLYSTHKSRQKIHSKSTVKVCTSAYCTLPVALSILMVGSFLQRYHGGFSHVMISDKLFYNRLICSCEIIVLLYLKRCGTEKFFLLRLFCCLSDNYFEAAPLKPHTLHIMRSGLRSRFVRVHLWTDGKYQPPVSTTAFP